jgi:hypothetical protein
MASNTDGMPASVRDAVTPKPDPKPGQQLTWKFLSGQDYTVIVEAGSLEGIYLAGSPDPVGWMFDTTDGRRVNVYQRNVMVFESRNVSIIPRKSAKGG